MAGYQALGPPPPFAGLDQVTIRRLQDGRQRTDRATRRFRGWDYGETPAGAEYTVFPGTGGPTDMVFGPRISVRVSNPVGATIMILAGAEVTGQIGFEVRTNVAQEHVLVTFSPPDYNTKIYMGDSGTNLTSWNAISSGRLPAGSVMAQDSGVDVGRITFLSTTRLGRLIMFPVIGVTQPGFIDFWTHAYNAAAATVPGKVRNMKLWGAAV